MLRISRPLSPSLLAPQIVPTAAKTPAGQPGLLRPSRTRFVASPRIGYANRPKTGNWRCGDLHPARLRPCRLLLSRRPAIQTTGRLTFAPAGLSPAEHTSLHWSHFHTRAWLSFAPSICRMPLEPSQASLELIPKKRAVLGFDII